MSKEWAKNEQRMSKEWAKNEQRLKNEPKMGTYMKVIEKTTTL